MKPLPDHQGQLFQDEFVDEFFLRGRGGIFVEIGAYDGKELSNTWFLEKHRGWTGLCIEANPDKFEELKANRECPCECVAAGEKDGEVSFDVVRGNCETLSALSDKVDKEVRSRLMKIHPGGRIEQITVKISRTQDILEKHGIRHIDYLSIDVDGSEMDVIRGIHFGQTKVRLMTVENMHEDRTMRNYLERQGIHLFLRDGWDDFYMSGDLVETMRNRDRIETNERAMILGVPLR